MRVSIIAFMEDCRIYWPANPVLSLCGIFMSLTVVLPTFALDTTSLRVEHKSNPSAVDTPTPRFSWRLESESRGRAQAAYHIRVTESSADFDDETSLLWDSGKVVSDRSHLVPYAGATLTSGTRCFWQVKVWDNTGEESEWSEPARWDVGILSASDWRAKWIEPNDEAFVRSRVAPIFRTEFTLDKLVKRATALVTAHGVYVAELNGRRVGDVQLAPGWTSYHRRLEYQQYDVTELLQQGGNVIGATVGQGWWRGHLHSAAKPSSARVASAPDYPDFYGDAPALFLQLDIEYADGTRQSIISNDSWKWSSGETVLDDPYAGETIDRRKRQQGWSAPGFDDSAWKPVRVADFGWANLRGQYRQPTRKLRELKPQRIFTDAEGNTIVDFGEHIAGWERVVLRGDPGDVVTLEHANIINSEGIFDTYTNRRAKQTTTCILQASGDELFEPRFVYYGFRYLKVDGCNGELQPEDFTAYQVAAAMPEIGAFECSDPLLTRFYGIIVRTIRGNTVAIPTDNPERNERLGWVLGSILDSACWSLDGSAFYASWLTDLAADQRTDGSVPSIAPFVTPLTFKDSTPGRSDYIITGPYRLYQQYGDKEMLRSFYPHMRRWVDYLLPRCTGFLREKEGRWGDWLAMRHNGQPQGADAHLLAQVYFAHALDLLSRIAAELGEDADAQMYADYEEKARQAFADHFLEADGRIKTPAQTQVTYMLPLALNAVPESMQPAVLDQWMRLFRSAHGVAEVGCISMPYFLPTLSRYGKTDELYKALLHDRIPSWRYMAAHEPTTTVWERWNGVRANGKYFHEPDENGKRPPGNMSAWNQPQLGNIGGTLLGVLAGIQPAEPGFKRIRIAPAIVRGGALDWVRASHVTPYGKVVSNWKLAGDTLTMEIAVPPNTTATAHVPARSADAVTESGKPLSEAEAVTFVKMENDHVVCGLQSGSYCFESSLAW
jgi:alpha-L-rhamnosidase